MGRPRKEETFAESEGLPANAHAKVLAKSKKEVLPFKEFYTLEGEKVLLKKVNKNGCYSTYIGRIDRDVKKEDIKGWQKKGQWVYSHDVDQVCSDFVATLG